MEGLKPCPFCGSKPIIKTSFKRYSSWYGQLIDTLVSARVRIHCPGCYVCMDVCRYVAVDISEKDWATNSQSKRRIKKYVLDKMLDEIWNRRADANVVERKTGKWIHALSEIGTPIVECSECGCRDKWYEGEGMGSALFGREYANFCSNCGAKMIGGDDNGT